MVVSFDRREVLGSKFCEERVVSQVSLAVVGILFDGCLHLRSETSETGWQVGCIIDNFRFQEFCDSTSTMLLTEESLIVL